MATNIERIRALEARATAVEKRLAMVEATLTQVMSRLGAVEGSLVALATRVEALERQPDPVPTLLSGASGDGVTSGDFETWRGSPVAIAGTWNDSYDGQTALWTIQPGKEYGSWSKALDVAVGAIYKDRGETWAAAASGAYDARWTTCLQGVKARRSGLPTFIRFAHEFNGSWVPWSVLGTEAASFVAAWKRFVAIARREFPEAKLVFCPNDGTSSSLNLDWRTCFPGATHVDVLGVDSYNQYPWVNTAADFQSKVNRVDSFGAPIGIEKHRLFAETAGLPFAVCEWSSNADMGDAPEYMRQFRGWLDVNRGTGPGKVAYEILFNVGAGFPQFQLYPTTKQPQAAAAYRDLW